MVGVGGAAQSLLAASYGTAPLPTAAPTHPSLLSRPLLHPLQPAPAKRIKLDDGLSYKTGMYQFSSIFVFSLILISMLCVSDHLVIAKHKLG